MGGRPGTAACAALTRLTLSPVTTPNAARQAKRQQRQRGWFGNDLTLVMVPSIKRVPEFVKMRSSENEKNRPVKASRSKCVGSAVDVKTDVLPVLQHSVKLNDSRMFCRPGSPRPPRETDR